MKTKTDKGEKVFINICKSDQVFMQYMNLNEVIDTSVGTCVSCLLHYMYCQVPTPREISDDELQKLMQSGDATQFRVPISLGEPHTEKDNGQ